MARYRTVYPPDWPAISHAIRYERAKGRCEKCGIKEGTKRPSTGGKIRLATAHLGIPRPDGRLGDPRDKSDCRPENLMALCQRCHLQLDGREHRIHAALTRRRKQRERLAALGYRQLEMAFSCAS